VYSDGKVNTPGPAPQTREGGRVPSDSAPRPATASTPPASRTRTRARGRLTRHHRRDRHVHGDEGGYPLRTRKEGRVRCTVSRQLGHANPSITLRIYARLFGAEEQATRMRAALERRFGGGNPEVTKGGTGERTGEVPLADVVSMRASGS
jgi:hypothetical protein